MIPVSIGAWLIVLAFPFIVVAALGWPIYVVRRYCAIRRGTTPRDASARFRRQSLVGGAICYVLLAIAVMAPTVSPALSDFVAKGGLAAVVPLIVLDIVLGAILSDTRAAQGFTRSGSRAELPSARATGRGEPERR